MDNFHTSNPVPANHPAWFPTLSFRNKAIQSALHQSNITGDWPNRVPIGPIQPLDPAMRISNRPEPRFTERHDRAAQKYYVPVPPVTKRVIGQDTPEAVLIYQPSGCPFRGWFNNVPYKVHGSSVRYHPY